MFKHQSSTRLNKRLGFTLIELLVVISIISLLASVVLTSVNSAREKARNVRRNEDIHQLILAFNLVLSANNSFPPADTWSCVSATCYGGYDGIFLDNWANIPADPTVDAFLATYLPNKPIDPPDSRRGSGGYAYINGVTGLVLPPDNFYYEYTLPGVYLYWRVEPDTSPNACGPGEQIASANYNWTPCMYKFN